MARHTATHYSVENRPPQNERCDVAAWRSWAECAVGGRRGLVDTLSEIQDPV